VAEEWVSREGRETGEGNWQPITILDCSFAYKPMKWGQNKTDQNPSCQIDKNRHEKVWIKYALNTNTNKQRWPISYIHKKIHNRIFCPSVASDNQNDGAKV